MPIQYIDSNYKGFVVSLKPPCKTKIKGVIHIMNFKILEVIKTEIAEYRILLRNVPSLVMALFVVSVILMNLLANKEISTGISWLALDCGLLVSWLSFLAMDMLTKRFGASASIKLSILAVGINLLVCVILFIVSQVPGNWGEFYTYNDLTVNEALNNTIGGTWYVLLGSTVAFIISAIINALINSGVGLLCKKDNFISYAARSYISTLVAQFIDNFIFALIVSHTFFGWSMLQCVTCSLTGCVVELLCEVVFSPIGYKFCKSWERDKVGQQYIEYMRSRR